MKQIQEGQFTIYTADEGFMLKRGDIYFQEIRWYNGFGTPDIEEVTEEEVPHEEIEEEPAQNNDGQQSVIEDLQARIEELERKLAEKED